MLANIQRLTHSWASVSLRNLTFLLFLRAVRIYGIMSFTDSRIILPLFSLSAPSPSSSCSSGSSSPSLRISQMFLRHRNHPSYATRRRSRRTFRHPALHELSSLSLLHSHLVYKQPALEDSLHIGGKFLHYIIVQRPKPLYAIEIYGRETKERNQ